MGHNIERDEVRSKSLSGSEYNAWFPVIDFNLNLFKRITTMAEAKALIWVLNYIGVPVAFIGWLLNIMPSTMNSWTASVLGFIGVFFAIAKLVVFCVTQYQNIRMRNLQLKQKEKKFKEGL